MLVRFGCSADVLQRPILFSCCPAKRSKVERVLTAVCGCAERGYLDEQHRYRDETREALREFVQLGAHTLTLMPVCLGGCQEGKAQRLLRGGVGCGGPRGPEMSTAGNSWLGGRCAL